ncbi:MAG: amidohydrolase family protein [archaeon]|nr:amidohydrolase family protein [archaeon]
MKNEWIDYKKTVVSDDPRHVPADPAPKGPEGTLVLKNGRIFDSTGKPVYKGSVVIERNKIKSILTPDSKDWPSDSVVIDVNEKTIMPGLIDNHTHLTDGDKDLSVSLMLSEADQTLRGAERLRYYIESGITCVRDVGAHNTVPFRLKDWIAQNRIPGPRIFAAGQFITGTGGHAAQHLDQYNGAQGLVFEASGPIEWREAVREQYKRGADFIKTGSHFSKEEITAAVDEAHSLGLKITTDAERFYIDWAIDAGIDVIEHPLPRSDEAIKKMAEKGVESVPTLSIYDIIFKYLGGGYFGSTTRKFTFSVRSIAKLTRKMKKAGIKMGVGTDLSLNMFRHLPDPYLLEMMKFFQIGFSGADVLIAATRINAEILNMDDKLGTLEPEKLADIIVVDGKPDEDFYELKKIDLVIRDGYIQFKDGRLYIEKHPELAIPKEQKTDIIL